jgi:hypothetical protein
MRHPGGSARRSAQQLRGAIRNVAPVPLKGKVVLVDFWTLVDLQLLGFELCVAFGDQCRMCAAFSIALGELREEGRGQIPQFFCVHFIELARQLHGFDPAIFAAKSKYLYAYFSL